jgi:hypothetical protein
VWADVSEKRITSIFRVENEPSKKRTAAGCRADFTASYAGRLCCELCLVDSGGGGVACRGEYQAEQETEQPLGLVCFARRVNTIRGQ